jgi:ABC-2 type transport system ATP-binding protein
VLKVACVAVAAVEVAGLTIRYGPPGTPPAVDDLHLTAEAGAVLVVLGPNGAGKTSTIETLEGYRRPTAGRVSVLGLDPRRDHAALSERVGVMLQRGGVYPMLGPRRVIDLFGRYYADPVPTDDLLERVGLRAVAGTPWRHLSGGEQQRLSLALALVGRPEVAFLDEPTAGVDPEGRLAVRAVIGALRDQGVCVVLTTHELAEAEKMADRVVIVCAGRVVRQGSPRELVTASAGPPSVRFGAPPGLDTVALARAAGAGGAVVEPEPGRYRVEAGAGTSAPALAAAVTAFLAERGATLTDLVVGRTLEDVYFEAIGQAAAEAPAAALGGGAGGRGRPRRGRGRGRNREGAPQ